MPSPTWAVAKYFHGFKPHCANIAQTLNQALISLYVQLAHQHRPHTRKNRKRLNDPCPYTWEKLVTPAWDSVIVGMRLSAFFIGRACDAGLVGVLREVPDAIEKGLGPSAVYLKSEAAPHSYLKSLLWIEPQIRHLFPSTFNLPQVRRCAALKPQITLMELTPE